MMTQDLVEPQAIAKNKLFNSTAEALEFWLDAAQKRETLPAKEYLEYIHSFGWSNRNTLPYIKLAEFIKNEQLQVEAIAKLDIRTLVKLPRPRYKSIVEAVKSEQLTQVEITKLIKDLPVKRREKHKSVEEKQDEVIGFNIPAATNHLLSRLEELTGLSKQRLAAEAFELLLEKMTEVAPPPDVDEQAVAQSELDAHIVEQGNEIDIESENSIPPAPCPLPPALNIGDAVQWQQGGEVYAAYLNQVAGDKALLDVGDDVFSVALTDLKKIDIEAIKDEISDRKKLSYPYQQLSIQAVNAKHEWVSLQALPDGDKSSNWHLQQYERWLSCAIDGAKRNGIWLDCQDLTENQRLVLIPGGEDLIQDVANTPRVKHTTTKSSFLEAFGSGVVEAPNLEQRLKDANDWDEVSVLVGKSNKVLSQTIELWPIEEKQLLVNKLAKFLEDCFSCAIGDNELYWLHQSSLAKGLAKLEFEIQGQVCKFSKFIDYGTPDELWSFRTKKGEAIIASREEVKVFKF